MIGSIYGESCHDSSIAIGRIYQLRAGIALILRHTLSVNSDQVVFLECDQRPVCELNELGANCFRPHLVQ